MYRACGEGKWAAVNEHGRTPAGGGRLRLARAVERRAVPAVEVLGQRIDDVNHALPVEQMHPRNRRPASNASPRSCACHQNF